MSSTVAHHQSSGIDKQPMISQTHLLEALHLKSKTLVDLEVEQIEKLQIVPASSLDSLPITESTSCAGDDQKGKLDFLESKISLLELLLEAKTKRITDQAKEIATLRGGALVTPATGVSVKAAQPDDNIVFESEDEDESDKSDTSSSSSPNDDVDMSVKKAEFMEMQRKLESTSLQESRVIAASFIHAESLYLNKLNQLECQIALDRMASSLNQQPVRLLPVASVVSVEKLEETVLAIQKLLKLEPNVSQDGLDLTTEHLARTLKESNEIIDLQHHKIQQVLDEQDQPSSSDSASTVLVRDLLHLVSTSQPTALDQQIIDICLKLLHSIQKEGRFLEAACTRLEDQLALNLEIKKLLVSVQVDKNHVSLLYRLNDLLKENADLKQQLHINSHVYS